MAALRFMLCSTKVRVPKAEGVQVYVQRVECRVDSAVGAAGRI